MPTPATTPSLADGPRTRRRAPRHLAQRPASTLGSARPGRGLSCVGRAALVLCLAALAANAHAASVSMTKGNTGAIVKWKQVPVTFHLHPACSADVNTAKCLSEVRKSFKVWEPPTCSNLAFAEGSNSYNLKLTAVGYNTNKKNEFAWVENSAWTHGKYVLGVTSPVFYTTGSQAGAIFEADIAMNGYLQTWSTSGANFTTDVMNVAVHEIGHFFGLQHNLYPNKSKPETMAPSADPYMGSRTPEQDDINAMCFLYPAGSGLTCSASKDCPYVVDDGPSGEYYAGQISCNGGVCNGPAGSIPAGGKKLGDTCVSDLDCDKPLFCQPLSGASAVCSQTCNPSQSGSCPSGYTCYAYQGSTTQGACLKGSGGGGSKKAVGETCTASSQCASGLCVNSGGKTTCEKPCTSDSQCGSGEKCSKFSGKSYGACVKDSGSSTPDKKPAGATCTASSQCASNICVGSGSTGTCVPECATKACPSGTNCLPLSSGKKGCFPGGSKKLGESCAGSSECSTSVCAPNDGKYVCTQLCGSGNPACPSGYQCFQVGGGMSACFPAAKKAGNGEACAGSSDCVSGLCIGSGATGTCVQPCTTDAQCGAGYACSPLSGGGGACTKLGDKQTGDPCEKPSDCASGTCVTIDGKASCTATCGSSVDCSCGFECTTFQSGNKYCTAGKKVACVDNGAACTDDGECSSDLCLNNVCTPTCSVFSGDAGCPSGKGCVRLEKGNPKGVCSTKGPEGFGAECASDTGCKGLFCHQKLCGQACNPFGPNSCPYGMSCEVAEGNVGTCVLPAQAGEDTSTGVDAGASEDGGAQSGGDGGATSDSGVSGGADGVAGVDTVSGQVPVAGSGGSGGGLCSAAPSGEPTPLFLLVLGALAVTVLRRRRVA